MADTFDAIILGAGAAGLFCGGELVAAGQRVCVLDHAKKPAEKVRISGGGRCNFTNLYTRPEAFLSANPHFAKSALTRYTPDDFCDLLRQAGISWHEKTLGQLFCDGKSAAIINLLLDRLTAGGGTLSLDTRIEAVAKTPTGYQVSTSAGQLTARHLIVATGGLSIPKMGATGLAYDLARQFGHNIIPTRPALVPLTFSGQLKEAFANLSGVATPARAEAGGTAFDEAILFTHRGLSGLAILQASSYWTEANPICLNLLPNRNGLDALKALRADNGKKTLGAALSGLLPRRLVDTLGTLLPLPTETRLAQLPNSALEEIAATLQNWTLLPTGNEGWRTAEVTAGGVDTAALSSRSLESKKASGLYFIGECVDVTGWLGGYNFQWAWASAAAAAENVARNSI